MFFKLFVVDFYREILYDRFETDFLFVPLNSIIPDFSLDVEELLFVELQLRYALQNIL